MGVAGRPVERAAGGELWQTLGPARGLLWYLKSSGYKAQSLAHWREINAHEFCEVAGVDQARLLAGACRDPRHGPAAQSARLAVAGH